MNDPKPDQPIDVKVDLEKIVEEVRQLARHVQGVYTTLKKLKDEAKKFPGSLKI